MGLKKKLLVALVICGVGIQFIPVEQENPPVTAEIAAAPEVLTLLRRACYDCHSNETVWPWYSQVAPFSLLLAHDVEEGREHLNFSEWGNYDEEDQKELAEECWEEVEEGEMPMCIYTPLHPEAKLDEVDLALLKTWAEGIAGPLDEH